MKTPLPKRPNLLKIIEDNYNNKQKQLRSGGNPPSLRSQANMSNPYMDYMDDDQMYYHGGYISDRAKATQFGQYDEGGLTGDKKPKRTKKPDSAFEDFVEIIDPSGITSWDDVYRSFKKSGMSKQTLGEIAGAVPLLGKAAKVVKSKKYLANTPRQVRSLNNFVIGTKGIGVAGRVNDANQVLEEYAPNEIFPDAGPDIIKYERFGPKYKRGGGYFPPYHSFTPPRMEDGGPGDISIPNVYPNQMISKFDPGGATTTNPPAGAAERAFLQKWNNSKMARQMLAASVDKDDPVGINSNYADKIREQRNYLGNAAPITSSDKETLKKNYNSIGGGNAASEGLGGFATPMQPSNSGNTRMNRVGRILGNPGGVFEFYGNNLKPNMYSDLSRMFPSDYKYGVYSQDFGGNKQLHDETVMHELSHASDYGGYFIPESDKKKMDLYAYGASKGNPNRGKFKQLGEFEQYVADPSETRARLTNFRFNANNQKLYNPFEEKITLDQLKKYKETEGGYDPLMQLKTTYSDQQIVDMLNSVSKAEPMQPRNVDMARYGGIYAYADGGNTKASIVDYLNTQGMASDKGSRKKLAESMGIKDYTGSYDQNVEMVTRLNQSRYNPSQQAEQKPYVVARTAPPAQPQSGFGSMPRMSQAAPAQTAPAPRVSKKPTAKQTPVQQTAMGQDSGFRPYSPEQLNQMYNFPGTLNFKTPTTQPASRQAASPLKVSKKPTSKQLPVSKQTTSTRPNIINPSVRDMIQHTGDFDRRGDLESGMITDKGTNTSYVIQNGKVVRSFPVLTGQARDANYNASSIDELAKNPSLRGTPVGTYLSKPDANLYGEKGFRMYPIPAFNQSAPAATPGTLAQHITFGKHEDPAEYRRREALYNQSPAARATSYGCTNCRKPDLDYMVNAFPQGDTTMVIDSRRAEDANLLKNRYKKKANGGENDDYSGTYSAGVYYGQGGSFVPEFYSPEYGLPEMMYGTGMAYGGMYDNGGLVKGGEYDMSEEEIQDLIDQGYKIQYI
jgi:hypothetical protein